MPAQALSTDTIVSASQSETAPVRISVHQFGTEQYLVLTQAGQLISLPVNDARRLVATIGKAVD